MNTTATNTTQPDYSTWSYMERLLDGKLLPHEIEAQEAAKRELEANPMPVYTRVLPDDIARMYAKRKATIAAKTEAREANEARRAARAAAQGRTYHKNKAQPLDRAEKSKVTAKWRAEIVALHNAKITPRGIAFKIKCTQAMVNEVIRLEKRKVRLAAKKATA